MRRNVTVFRRARRSFSLVNVEKCDGFSHLVVDGDLGVGVSFVERLDLAEMMRLRQLHHTEQHGDLC